MNQKSPVAKFRSRKIRIFKNYRKFIDLGNFVESLLTLEQQKKFEIVFGEITINFAEQILIYFEERYDSGAFYEEIAVKANDIFEKYKFLFESNLNNDRIRTILLREIIETTTYGSQCFYRKRNRIKWRRNIWWRSKLTGTILKVKKKIEKIYPNLPKRKDSIKWKNCSFSLLEELFINRKPIKFENTKDEEIWITEFLKSTKWFFERLNTCKEEQQSKYMERIFQESNSFIGKEQNCSHTFLGNFLPPYEPKIKTIPKDPETNRYLTKIVENISQCFTEEAAANLSEISSESNCWIFKQQLWDRFYSRYPPFASWEEIKKHISEKCDLYRPLLAGEKKDLAKEIFMDELEKELFISQNTHAWNQEMFKNLTQSTSNKTSSSVKWAIGQIISFLNLENSKELKIKLEDKEYDLKTLLIARWKRATLAQGKNSFSRRLLEIFTTTPYQFQTWKDKGISKIELQIFLDLVDSCFLYPKPGRFMKILLSKNDTGDVSKWRKNAVHLLNEFNCQKWFSDFQFVLLVFAILLLIFVWSLIIYGRFFHT